MGGLAQESSFRGRVENPAANYQTEVVSIAQARIRIQKTSNCVTRAGYNPQSKVRGLSQASDQKEKVT